MLKTYKIEELQMESLWFPSFNLLGLSNMLLKFLLSLVVVLVLLMPGSRDPQRFIKVATNETFHSREDMLRYVAYEREANQPAPAPRPIQPLVFCNRCRNIGHEAHQCGYSEAYVMAINALYPRPAPAPEPERR
ncbi:uncharacterized protein LOC123217750 isoform X1 [Mangifera indica]|uniref:uncharacterized protein LOC123217750 isoform X1 n=1 Tax=Mangifera indica TaxID=29780 RepID=UPI001CFAA47A|nr:uncharacterized protein LOC123217750 isoform X1 [Mangifera indica]